MVSRGKIVFIKTIFWNKNCPFRGYFRSIGPLFSRLHLVLSISIVQVGGCINTYPSISGIKIVSNTTFLGTQNDQFRGLFLVPRPSLIRKDLQVVPRLKVLVQDGPRSRKAPRGVQGLPRDPAEKKI